MKGLGTVLVLFFILVAVLASFTATIAELYVVCPERACDFDKVPVWGKFLFFVISMMGVTTYYFSMWLLTVWFQQDSYTFRNGYEPFFFAFVGWSLFVFSVIAIVFPWLVALGFFVRGLPINFPAACFIAVFSHLNAVAVSSILLKPSKNDVFLK